MNTQFQLQTIFLVIISGLLIFTVVESVRFDLDSGQAKCISEDIKTNAMTVGKFSIVNPNEGHPLPDSHKITVRVTSAYGNKYHYSDQVNEGHFAFQAVEEGDYMACFIASDHKPSIKMTIEFDWKSGLAAKDWNNVVKKGSIESMEFELKQMLDKVQSIRDEMLYLRERGSDMWQLNRSTNSKMNWLSFLSLIICSSVAGLQVWHLKTYFQKKKII